MAEYTIELRTIVENGKNIFSFDYPFYNEKERPNFEKKFIRHFYFREIGSETIDRFILNLEDKMNTVFPYYNELFKTAEVEYSILDNYDIRETTTLKRAVSGSASGESYAVGQTFDEHNTNVKDHRTAEKTDNGTTTTTNTQKDNATSELTRNATNNGETSETIDGTKSKNGTETSTENQNDVKKFLDTPQSAVDLKNSNYLTNLHDDTANKNGERTANETTKDDQTTSGTSSNTENESTEKTTDRTVTDNGNTQQTLNGTETADANTDTSFNGEQKTTNDSAVRSRSEGETSETIEHTRKGNIGVDTDADMIQKHIKLQQILKKIEMMFFDECEDLFMLVF